MAVATPERDADARPDDEPTEPSLTIAAAEAARLVAEGGDAASVADLERPPPVARGAYLVRLDGEVFEAPDAVVMGRWITERRVHPDDEVATADGVWVKASAVPELVAIFQALQAPRVLPVRGGAPPGADEPGPLAPRRAPGTPPPAPAVARSVSPTDSGAYASPAAVRATQHDDVPIAPQRRGGLGLVVAMVGVAAVAAGLGVALLTTLWSGEARDASPSAGGEPPQVEAAVAVEATDVAPEAVAPPPEPPPPAVEEEQAPPPAPAPAPAPRPTADPRPVPKPAPAPEVARVVPTPPPAPPPAPPKARPVTYQALVDAGWSAVEADDLVEAVLVFRQAIELDERRSDAHYGLGYALIQKGRLATGRLHLCRARPGLSSLDQREIDGVLRAHDLSCDG